MNKIHFNKLSSWQNGILIIPAVVFIFIAVVGIFNDSETVLTKISAIIGNGLMIIFFGNMFFYKNYVGWNKMGITIRIKSFFGETINFKDIKTKEFTNDVLNISKINGNEIKIDLSGIKKSDIDELNNILTKYTIAKNA